MEQRVKSVNILQPSKTIPSQALHQRGEGVETEGRAFLGFQEDDMARSSWRQGERSRNDCAIWGIRFPGVTRQDGQYDLLGDSTITTAFQRGAPRGFDEQPELIGYLGMYMNFSLFESTNARIFSSQGATGADVYVALAMGKDAYGVTEIDSDALQTYFQPLGSGGAIDDPLHQVGSLGWKVNFTAELLPLKGLRRCLVTGSGKGRELGGHLAA